MIYLIYQFYLEVGADDVTMKIMLKTILSIFSWILIYLFWVNSVSASTLYLSPGSGSINQGGTLAVQVRLNTQGEGVNAVSAYLSYPEDKLSVSYVKGGSSFAIEAENSFGGGAVKISRGSISPVSGNVTVATIGFKGKALGNATVAFIGGSAVPRASDSSDSLNLGASSGGAYKIVAQQAQQADQTAKASPTTAPKTAIQLIAEKPKISDIKVGNIGTSSATINWKTDKPADSTVDYGLEKGKYFITNSDDKLVTEHSLNLPGQILTPGTKFYFRILAKDAQGNTGQSDDMDFQLLDVKKPQSSPKSFFLDRMFVIVTILIIVGLVVVIIILKKMRKKTDKPPEAHVQGANGPEPTVFTP